MLMTRPHAASRSFVASLPKNLLARLKPVYNPLIKIISLKYGVSISNTEAAIFTSMNGVILVLKEMAKRPIALAQQQRK